LAKLKELLDLHSYKPKNIYNFDETMVQFNGTKCKVVTPAKAKYGVVKEAKLSFHITLCFCIAASGGHIPSLSILPLKNFPADLAETAGHFCWSGQESGWINKVIFADYMEKVFIPHAKRRRGKNERVLLIMDGHSSRNNATLMEKLSEHLIDVLILPAHASHILQPLDLTVNGSFKSSLAVAKRFINFDADTPTLRKQVMEAAAEASERCMWKHIVRNGFQRAGICPFEPKASDGTPCAPVAITTPSTIDADGKASKKKHKRFSISNQVLTSAEVIGKLEGNEEIDPDADADKEFDYGDGVEGVDDEEEEKAATAPLSNQQTHVARAPNATRAPEIPQIRPAVPGPLEEGGNPTAEGASVRTRQKRARTGRFTSVVDEGDLPLHSRFNENDFLGDIDDFALESIFQETAHTPLRKNDHRERENGEVPTKHHLGSCLRLISQPKHRSCLQ